MLKRLRYGNTNCFFLRGLLVDTDYAGTLQAFYREIKRQGIRLGDVRYVLATHYHPDHMGLIGSLTEQGVRLLLADTQREAVHFSDPIFARERRPFVPIHQDRARVISCGESRAFLAELGIAGELLSTPSHSPDSVTLLLDSGDCLVGDLEPLEYLEVQGDNEALRRDWDRILARRPKRIHYAHWPERILD